MVESGGWCWWVNCSCLVITSLCGPCIQPAVSNKQKAQSRISLSAVSLHITQTPSQSFGHHRVADCPTVLQLEELENFLGSIHPAKALLRLTPTLFWTFKVGIFCREKTYDHVYSKVSTLLFSKISLCHRSPVELSKCAQISISSSGSLLYHMFKHCVT